MSAGAFLLAALLVGLGGGVGSVLRWALREGAQRWIATHGRPGRGEEIRPWATVAANSLACFLIGAVVAKLGSATGNGELFYLLLAVGFCGGLSTLSTAAQDIVDLVRRGTFSIALAYLMLSAGIGMGALWVGMVIAS